MENKTPTEASTKPESKSDFIGFIRVALIALLTMGVIATFLGLATMQEATVFLLAIIALKK